MSARWLPWFFFVFSRPARMFPCFWLCCWGHEKRWISVAGVLRAMVFCFFVVALWQVVVLSFFVHSFVLPRYFLCFELFVWGQTKRWISVSGTFLELHSGFRSSGHCVLWFCFLVTLRFECTLASLIFLCDFSSCYVFPCFLLCCWGHEKRWLLACCVP